MDNIDSGKQVLREAEQALRKLMAAAATHGEYAALPVLADWAQQVGSLIDADSETPEQRELSPGPRARVRPSKKSSKKKRSARYPRFIKEEGQLVKIGWSKRDAREYEHKAPQDVVRAVVASLSRAGVRGQRFTMESVLPLKNLDGTPIPDYQSYLILAWLRSTQLITQHGRLGYTVPQNVDLVDAVEGCWARLAARSHSAPSKKAQ